MVYKIEISDDTADNIVKECLKDIIKADYHLEADLLLSFHNVLSYFLTTKEYADFVKSLNVDNRQVELPLGK